MIKKILFMKINILTFISILYCCTIYSQSNTDNSDSKKLEVLIITGQNNHYWQGSSKVIEGIFNNSELFNATVIISPEKGKDISNFKPSFDGYDLICLDYNGDSWPEETKINFVNFVKNGGGLVLFHASDNSFSDWEEYNRMIGVGGWGGRTEKNGPILYWENGEIKKDKSEGNGGAHGQQLEFVVYTRMPEHPIMKGLPESWLHTQDELYHSLRGPAKKIHVLATAEQDKEDGGSGRQEPVLMTINYGKGKIFHSTLGHTGKDHNNTTLCAGFITTLLRGSEWVATGNVTQEISADFPDAEHTKIWNNMKAPEYK